MNKEVEKTLEWFGCLSSNDEVTVILYTNKADYEEYRKTPNLKNISSVFKAKCDLEAYLKAHDYFFKSIMTLK